MSPKSPRPISFYVNALCRVCLACVVAAIPLAILFPLYADRLTGYNSAYHNVLSKHKMPPYIRHYGIEQNHEVSKREPCLMAMSWFPEGRSYDASTCAVGVEGTIRRTRILWNNGTRGGYDKPITDQNEMNALKELAALPTGLESPDDVTYGRLLIISSEQQGQWTTHYYDRANLPAPIGRIIHLLGLEITPRPLAFR